MRHLFPRSIGVEALDPGMGTIVETDQLDEQDVAGSLRRLLEIAVVEHVVGVQLFDQRLEVGMG